MAENPRETQPLQYLDNLLAEYYKLQGDDSYYNTKEALQWSDNTPKGKFGYFCDENGIEHDMDEVTEELSTDDAKDCMYCDFDANGFPIDASVAATDRIKEIFRVICHCWNHGKAPRKVQKLDIEWKTDETDKKSAADRYSAQCPAIFGSQEADLCNAFAIGLKNNIPFISYLVDAYQRDKMMTKDKMLEVAEWGAKSPLLSKINSKSKSQAETIQSGVKTYMKRLAHPFHWTPANKIHDNIQQIVKYFVAASQFVGQMLQSQSTPFSYDVMILVKKTVSQQEVLLPPMGDSSDDDEEDDGENKADDDYYNKDGKDYFGNIEAQLKGNQCTFVKKSLQSNNRGVRFFIETFKEFNGKLGAEKYKDKSAYNMASYPRKKRFCSVIDRRGDGDDDFFLYEPPDDCNTIPEQHVADWFFNAGVTCIVPSMYYQKPLSQIKKDEFDPQDTLKTNNAYKGKAITISFHVEQQDVVRCYLFWNGCYVRIVSAQDLKHVLHTIFDVKYQGNEKYLNSDKPDDDLQGLNVQDEVFDLFYKEVTTIKEQDK